MSATGSGNGRGNGRGVGSLGGQTAGPGPIPPAVVEATMRALEAHLHREGWDVPCRLFGLVLAEDLPAEIPTPVLPPVVTAMAVVVLHDAGGRPYEVLEGRTAPPWCSGLALALEGWSFPRDVLATNPDPAVMGAPGDHPRRVEVRILHALMRDGTDVAVMRERGRAPSLVVGSADCVLSGRVAAALRRNLGLPSPPTAYSPGTFLGRLWACRAATLAQEANDAGAVPDPGVVDRADPAATMRDALLDHPELFGDEDLPPGFLEALAHLPPEDSAEVMAQMLSALGWEVLRAMAVGGTLPGMDPALAGWMDADMFAEFLMEEFPPSDHVLETLAVLVGADAAAGLARCLGSRGWAEPPPPYPPAPATRPRRPPPPLTSPPRRNDPCPCGSGRKYKHCHDS